MFDANSAIPVPDVSHSVIVARPEMEGKGNWSGGPSALKFGDQFYMAYRLRSSDGRGRQVAVGASDDGIVFEPLAFLEKDDFGAASLERPSLVKLPDGGWRLYVSCSTPNSYHWWIDAIDAEDPREFDPANRTTVWPGDSSEALKDPVVLLEGTLWHAWVCAHPLADPGATDRMKSVYYTSDDGLDWRSHGTALDASPGTWFERGARIAWVVRAGERWVAYFDGRASAAENAEELTGVASGDHPDRLVAEGTTPFATAPSGSGSLRYLSLVDLGNGTCRLYYEASLADASHALFTQLWTPTKRAGYET